MTGCLFLIGLAIAIGLLGLALVGILGALTMLAIHLTGFIVLILDILAVVEILRSRDEGVTKAVWILIIFFLPVLGLILWYFLGRKKSR